MIIVKNLTKKYNSKVKDEEVIALNKINLVLPDKGFIAVYGASGCGKSTLLNVLGGLDQADFGEMIVNGRSTKGFTAHDWNSYRNQEVGFVFQNYFLLPHLNVFDNIAVTLQMSKQTENLKEKIHNALTEVDLAKFAKRYPRQLSGGQQQRVAIARALIANPSIILADEPTGALDEKSSKMVMKTLKEVSKDHLVVMVTHNERMAKEYAERLIEISYGNIIYDSNPLDLEKVEKVEKKPLSPVHLPFRTSIKWSVRNVVKKKGRSIPIAIASGIGLAAAGVVMSMTQGVNDYVGIAQKAAIKDYPVYVTCHSKNSSESNEANLQEFPDSQDIVIEKSDYKAQEHYITMQDDFMEYMKGLTPGKDYAHVSTNKSVKFNMFTKSTKDSYVKVESTSYTTCIAPTTDTYKFLLDDQYDLIAGDHLPTNKNEMTLVVDTFNRIDLYALQRMGFDTSGDKITAQEVFEKTYKIVSNDDFYYPEDKEVKVDDTTITREVYKGYGTSHYEDLYENHGQIDLKIVSIIRPKEKTTNTIYNNILLYHPDLIDFLLNETTGLNTLSHVVQLQKSNTEWDIVTGNNYVASYQSGYELTPTYQHESRLVDLGGKDRITAFYFYTDTFDQRNRIIEYADNYQKKKSQVDPESDIVIRTRDYLESVTSSFTSLVKTFSTILMAFSLVSVLVAAILTAILTYISVVERKREIGLLRSLGARQRDISYMFITEASLIGIVAGVLGVALCYLLAPLASKIVVNLIGMANTKILTPTAAQFSKVQPWLIPVLFAGAIVIGIVSSLVPAIIAGHKKPADALKE
ncbi:MAG: ABC transporter ATP-binding protein/permease [Bacilli bacterium]|nr:ABC transporter ATP-binding protein/permease [Bacilli bacterium]